MGRLEIISLLMDVIECEFFIDMVSSDMSEAVLDCSYSWAYSWRGWSSGYESGEIVSGCLYFMLSGGIDREDEEDEDTVDM